MPYDNTPRLRENLFLRKKGHHIFSIAFEFGKLKKRKKIKGLQKSDTSLLHQSLVLNLHKVRAITVLPSIRHPTNNIGNRQFPPSPAFAGRHQSAIIQIIA